MTPLEEMLYARIKPMRASDWQVKHLKFPLWAQPKIDGVRALNQTGTLTGRSLKKHKNRFNTEFFSHGLTLGLDGEMAAWSETAPDLCRRTTSALNTIEGEPFCLWWLFDLVTLENHDKSYCERYADLKLRMDKMRVFATDVWSRVRLVPYKVVYNLEELEAVDAEYVALGFEGTIIRDPYGLHKSGRSTALECGLLRIKRFVEEEAVVLSLQEGETNANEAKVNELGHTERSTHAENMIPNGKVGAMVCKDVKTGQTITVGAGCMTHPERLHYWAHPDDLVGKTIKYKCFSHGRKDLPRFPTFQSIRAESDI